MGSMPKDTDTFFAVLPQDQAEQLRLRALELFSAGEMRFGGCILRAGESAAGDTFIRDKVRYRLGAGELVTIHPWEFSVDDPLQATEDSPVEVAVDKPLPSVPAWLNTYVREAFVLGQSLAPRDVPEPYDYELCIQEFSSEGNIIKEGRSIGLMAEAAPNAVTKFDRLFSSLLDPEGRSRNALAESGDEQSEQERKLAVMHRLFPEVMGRFKLTDVPHRFQAVFRDVMALTPQLEVGCSPNPYIRTP